MTPGVPAHLKPLNAAGGASAAIDSTVRLRLNALLGRRGTVDGAWWPRSRNAAAELPALIAVVDQRLAQITMRIGLHADGWDDTPQHVPAPGRRIRVGWFRRANAHLISLVSMGAEPIRLLVIPPDTAAGPAAAALTLSVDGAPGQRPIDILRAAHRPAATGLGTPDADGHAGCENESGNITSVVHRLNTGPPATRPDLPGRQALADVLRMERS
ncbi:DUF5994 family protein [Spongiactinospora sp. TRM90649]|uniref:DUF5994 family protein n=1 Tax=Spongiactinospora sp. TRM90649 TaxID=3031114 RepID=UPI0023F75B84|nr:DUF5994 family protein [Spongiactinospora sp. TRM90649]MDF5754616.1 DUF5994 family protein [Spongiactinospora sp. TRM90649]